MNDPRSGGRWVPLVTGGISILIGLIYLVLVTVLDSRSQMLPPPPEALGVVVVDVVGSFRLAQQFF